MKKLFLGIYVVSLVVFFNLCAGDDEDLKMCAKNKPTKEECRFAKKEKQEKRKLIKKQKQADQKLKKEQKKRDKKIKKLSKEKKPQKTAEEKKLDKIHRAEERNARQMEHKNNSKAKKEQHRLKVQQRKEAEHMAVLKEQTERNTKLAKQEEEKLTNLNLLKSWKTVRLNSVKEDYKEGKYANLYMLPAWPVASWFFKDKALVNATAFYHYAIDAYDSNGASKNITTLAFGESPIHIRDVVLASELFSDHGTEIIDFRIPTWISPINNLLRYLGDQEIKLHGRTEQYGLSLDFMRHVLRDDVSIGIQVPMMFMRNRLHVSMDFPTDQDFYNQKGNPGPQYEFTTHCYYEALKRIFRAKDIDEFGNSTSGIGDITLFGNVEITTKWIEKIVAGCKFVLPTSKKMGAHKLWNPPMGNDGCTEIDAFVSFLTRYNKYINPHLFLQAGFNVPARVNRRAPRWVKFETEGYQDLPIDLMSLADRLQGTSFESWDSTIRGFSDEIISAKFEKGPEITGRIGNIFDKFLFRRGFMDIFYNLRVKFEDSYREVNRDQFKIDMFKDNTKQVEHRVGFEYSHQFDSNTRMKTGFIYTFAGVNVPKAFDFGVSFAHSF